MCIRDSLDMFDNNAEDEYHFSEHTRSSMILLEMAKQSDGCDGRRVRFLW